jgi:acetyl esterase/lipase
MKQRSVAALPGIYQDFRSVRASHPVDSLTLVRAARDAGAQVVLTKTPSLSGIHEGVLFLGGPESEKEPLQFPDEPTADPPKTPKEQRDWETKFKHYPDEVFAVAPAVFAGKSQDRQSAAFRNASMHILARELSETEVRTSLAEGHVYIAHDWLCDPAGFAFIAENNLGVYEMGDNVPLMNTMVQVRLPIPAKLKLLRNDAVVAEVTDSKLNFAVKQEGAYRLEAWLSIDGEDHPWIYSNPLYVARPASFTMPPAEAPPNVEIRKDILYTDGEPADAAKHKLDLYLPKDKKNFPILVFVHGGSWHSGDRAMYAPLGHRFAKLGLGVVIPSYRLMPKNQHPAQMEDVAAAFAWAYKNAAQYGGDPKRIFLIGHSSGGHLAALLALDQEYLKKYDIPAGSIQGVVALSGVFDVTGMPMFVSGKRARDPSPLHSVRAQAPPFLITFCQWDYAGLPNQAREFSMALKKHFVGAQLVYIPRENHITEIINIWKDDDPIARAILEFIK